MKRIFAFILSVLLVASLAACATQPQAGENTGSMTVTDMIGREVSVTPGSYKKVVCIGAGALRMYSYIGDASLLAGVEDIDNTTLSERPKMFDSVARPYVLAFGETFNKLPSCGVGGPMAQAAEAEAVTVCLIRNSPNLWNCWVRSSVRKKKLQPLTNSLRRKKRLLKPRSPISLRRKSPVCTSAAWVTGVQPTI